MADVCLVQMPYSMLYTPSLALGILKSCLVREGFSCRVFYGDIAFADAVGIELYKKFLDKRIIHQFAEMSFAGNVWYDGEKDAPAAQDGSIIFREYLEKIVYPMEGVREDYFELLKNVQEIIPGYLENLADDILKEKPLIVGCSSNFQQNNASFALLKEIKKKVPHVVTIMGGSNCALEAGQAVASEVEWVDYVFSGEGEFTIPEFCRLVGKYGKDIPEALFPEGVMSAQTVEKEPAFPRTMNLEDIPLPDFTEYFAEADKMSWMKKEEISLAAEGSRGCWWREKQGCTFCGLCIKDGQYRRKSTERLLQELLEQSSRYGVNRFFLTDSILSNEMIAEFPKLVDALPENPGFRLFGEVKSNMRPKELESLKRAGFHTVQPGIEAIQDGLLKQMNKGNSAIRHLEFLKSAQQCKMKLSWNLLFGFPGEEERWVEETLNLIPLLTHLPPPNGAMHILFQKYSHYYENRALYGLCLKRLPAYDYIYGFQGALAEGISYNFYPGKEEILKAYFSLKNKEGIYRALTEAVSDWREHYYTGDCLQMRCYDERIEIMDLRAGAKHSYYEFWGAEKELYLYCGEPKKEREILGYMEKIGQPGKETKKMLGMMKDALLLAAIGDEYLALAVLIGEAAKS